MNTLLIFAKFPEPGRVKTRLARTLGFVEAARLYRNMVETIIEKTTPLNEEYQRTLCFDPPEREDDFRRWFPAISLYPQEGADLGERLAGAIRQVSSEGNRVVVIGSDCIDVDQKLVHEAFQRLERSDVVVGPAVDGGYYLLGMKRPHLFLFQDVPWSTEKVFFETIRKAKKENLKIELLKTLSDVDEIL